MPQRRIPPVLPAGRAESVLAALMMLGVLAVTAPCAPSRAAGAGTPAPAAAGGDAAARIGALQKAGRLPEALALLEQELSSRPGDALLLYNRACLQNRLGRGEEAVASLRAAIEAGFDDLDFAAADPDLREGAAAARLAQAIADGQARRGAMSDRRGARLAQDAPVSLALEPAPGAAPDGSRVTVTWRPTGLELRLETGADGARCLAGGDSAPWSGGGGLVVALGPLDADGSGRTSDAFVFGFGLEKDAGVGAVYVPESGGWQRVRELAPKIRGAGTGKVTLDATIPWAALKPYHPLVDPSLGFNATLVGRGGAAAPRLMPARILDRPGEARHLGARLEFDVATAAPGSLAGRTPTSLLEGGQLAVNLVAVSATAGRGRLELTFQDADGNPLLEPGLSGLDVELEAGVTRLNRAVAFDKLRPGPCRMAAELAFPDGSRATWAAWILYLGPAWQEGYEAAIAGLRPDERPTAAFFLARARDAVAAHRGRRDPGPLSTTLADLNQMLARAAGNGSLVPAEGLVPFVYPGPGGADRLCRLVLPPGRPEGAPLRPVVLAGHAAPDAPRLADRLARLLAGRPDGEAQPAPGAGWPVYVVAPGQVTSPAELEACLAWAGGRFGREGLLLAAQREALLPALEAAAGAGAGLSGLLLFVDGTVAGPAAATGLPRPRAGQSVGWIEFENETAVSGGGRALGAALRAAGWRLEAEGVKGGANFTQVADRVQRWAAAMARPATAR